MTRTRKMVFAGFCLMLCMVLPLLTGQIPNIGQMLAPMHFPVYLCGFICGPFWGAAVGFVAPLLRFLLFQMPPLYPVGTAMAFEMATYGFVSGFLYQKFHQKPIDIYGVLIAAMLVGRAVWGAAMWLLMALSGESFTLTAFLTFAFATALPGIISQLLLIPPIVLILKKHGWIATNGT